MSIRKSRIVSVALGGLSLCCLLGVAVGNEARTISSAHAQIAQTTSMHSQSQSATKSFDILPSADDIMELCREYPQNCHTSFKPDSQQPQGDVAKIPDSDLKKYIQEEGDPNDSHPNKMTVSRSGSESGQ